METRSGRGAGEAKWGKGTGEKEGGETVVGMLNYKCLVEHLAHMKIKPTFSEN